MIIKYLLKKYSKKITIKVKPKPNKNSTQEKMDIDPAIASSVFVTTITDVIGFVSFLGVSAYFF